MENLDKNILRSVLLSQVMNLDMDIREGSANLAARSISKKLKKARISYVPYKKTDQKTKKHLKELHEDGITILGKVLTTKQINEIKSHLTKKKAFAGHVWSYSDMKPKELSEIENDNHQASYLLEDIIEAPHLIELANNPLILNIAQQYLGCVPSLYQMNVMHSFHKYSKNLGVAQNFHRDVDNLRFCVLFVYLTDVDRNSGPHQYIKKTTHFSKIDEVVKKYNKQTKKNMDPKVFFDKDKKYGHEFCEKVFKNDIEQIEGPAGYAFLADVYGLHRGLPPLENDRLLFWARYGLYDNGFISDTTPKLVSSKLLENRIKLNRTTKYINRAFLTNDSGKSFNKMNYNNEISENFDGICDQLASEFGKWELLKQTIKIVFKKRKTRR